MKTFKILILGALMAMITFSSCTKEDPIDTTITTPTEEVDDSDVDINPLVNRSSGDDENGLLLDCITVLYPFDMVDDQDNTYTITADTDFETIFTDSVIIVDFVYPLDVLVNDESVSIADAYELGDVFVACVPAGGWEEGDFPAYEINYDNSCYSLSYPVDLLDLEGNITSIDSEEAFNNAVTSELYFFVFPIILIHEDGTTLIVNDIDELFDALITCNGFENNDTSGWDWENGFEYIGCYTVEFPLSVVVSDGSTVTVNDHMELCDLMITGELVDYAYPLTLTDEDGNEVVVENSEELSDALNECWGDWEVCSGEDVFTLFIFSIDDGNGACFDIQYPISATDVDGGVVEITDAEAYNEAMNTALLCELVYPITIVIDGESDELENSEETFLLFNLCQ